MPKFAVLNSSCDLVPARPYRHIASGATKRRLAQPRL
jgi:hypothetical protein